MVLSRAYRLRELADNPLVTYLFAVVCPFMQADWTDR